MKFSKLWGIGLGAVLALIMGMVVAVPATYATSENQMTKITINVPFRVPGHEVLTAGTYWFRTLGNNSGSSNVVQIYNADKSKLLDTALTRPTLRMDSTNRTELSFATGSRQTPTLVRWFYPGRDTGFAFIYSTQVERRIHEDGITNVVSSPMAG